MLNMFTVVGRLQEITTDDNNANITLAVQRTFKDEEGNYDTDLIKFKLYGTLAESTKEFCSIGSVIGIKGRIQTNNESLELIAEKILFLSSKSKEQQDESNK